MDLKFFFLILSLFAPLRLSSSGQVNSIESVPDLEKLMYKIIDGYPCVRLLNLTGEIGCSNPGRDKVIAPLVNFNNINELAESSTILVSLDKFETLFTRLSKDSNFAKHVAGVLVESGNETLNKLKVFSPDKKFPQSEFSPYKNHDYEWNPSGSGLMWQSYNFPVFLLSENATSAIREVTAKNENKKDSYTKDVAEFDLVMQTTKSEVHNSESCLEEFSCLPLGGYSVLSALPPINNSPSEKSKSKSKPIILTVASMDSASFFRDKSLGADSPISGLIALLAAVDSLSHLNDFHELPKQLVFVVFTGESWGYLGSQRFLLEFDQQNDNIDGIDLKNLEMVLEIGSVGKISDNGVKTFYTHTTGDTSFVNETLNALKKAQESLKSESIKISMAGPTNPGIPPSSMMTFVNKKPQTSGIVLSDFDSVFTNKFYHSHLDDLSNINSSAIISASTLIARTLYILATNNSQTNTINVNSTLIQQLLNCILNCDPNSQCDLFKNYISPTITSCPSNYVGVIQQDPSLPPNPNYILDLPRFIWNFLAHKTSIHTKNLTSTCPNNCNGDGQICIQSEIDNKGLCVISTTRYVPAYSPRLKMESGKWKVIQYNDSDIMGKVDPVWTESNWEKIGLRVYTMQNGSYDRIVLVLGLSVTVMAYIVIVIVRGFIAKALKRD